MHLDDPDPLGRLYRDFLAAHDRVYGYATEAPAGIVNLRTIHSAAGSDSLDVGTYKPKGGAPEKGRRLIRFANELTPIEARILDRGALPVGFEFEGPAIVEQDDTTTVVEPGWKGRVARDGNLILRVV